jgi:Arc/MetJ family transcription regulator
MGAHMKTTIEISDALLQAAKRMASERGTTLRMVVETALRRHLEGASDQAQTRLRLRRHSFRGRGLQSGLSESDWSAIRERAYEGRGG